MTLTWIHLAIEIVRASVIIAKNVFDYLREKTKKKRGTASADKKTRTGRKTHRNARDKRLRDRRPGVDGIHRVKTRFKGQKITRLAG